MTIHLFVGGFKIQLLDSRGRHLQDLTPEGEWVGDRLTRHTVIWFSQFFMLPTSILISLYNIYGAL